MFQCETSDKLGPGLCLATRAYNASDKTQRFLRKHSLCTQFSIVRIENHEKLALTKVYCYEKCTCAKNKVRVSNAKLRHLFKTR